MKPDFSVLKNQSSSTQIKVLEGILKDTYKNSLYAFSKHCLGYSDMNKKTHGAMVQALEDQTKRKCIVMPRGTFKSSIGVVGYSIWSLLRNPNERILIDSELYSNSKNFLREIKAHLQSKDFIELFGDWRGENWNESEITISTRTKPYKEASITCGGIETVKVGQHYSLIISDDLNSGNNSNSPEACEKVIRHYQMNTAILEPDGSYVVIGTRYHIKDLIGWILDNECKSA